MSKFILIFLVLLLPLGAVAAPPLPVDQPFNRDSDALNSLAIEAMGYANTLRVGRTYHFRFSDGVIKRFKFVSRFSSYKFNSAGRETQNQFSRGDMIVLMSRFHGGIGYVDFSGARSFFGSFRFNQHAFTEYTITSEEIPPPNTPDRPETP